MARLLALVVAITMTVMTFFPIWHFSERWHFFRALSFFALDELATLGGTVTKDGQGSMKIGLFYGTGPGMGPYLMI